MAALAAEVGSQRSRTGDRSAEAGGQKPETRTETAEESVEESAAVATAASTEPTEPMRGEGAPPPPDDEGYVWPEGAAPTEASPAEAEPLPDAPLPKMDELVERLSPAVRETLDELFRVKFVGVRRVPKQVLKS